LLGSVTSKVGESSNQTTDDSEVSPAVSGFARLNSTVISEPGA